MTVIANTTGGTSLIVDTGLETVTVTTAHAVDGGIQARIDFDDTHGWYVRRIDNGEYGFDMVVGPAWRAIVWDTVGEAYSIVTSADATLTADSTTGRVRTLTFTYGGWLTVNCKITRSSSNDEIRFTHTFTETSLTLACAGVNWPYLNVEPPGEVEDLHFVNPVFAGHVIPDCTRDAIEHAAYGCPPAMQCWSVYDSTTKKQLYFQTDDDAGIWKLYSFAGTGESFRLYWTHFPSDNKAPGKTYTQPYNVICRLKTGEGPGATGYWDTFAEYKTWATDAARTWLPDTWKTDVNIPAIVQDERLFIVIQGPMWVIKGFVIGIETLSGNVIAGDWLVAGVDNVFGVTCSAGDLLIAVANNTLAGAIVRPGSPGYRMNSAGTAPFDVLGLFPAGYYYIEPGGNIFPDSVPTPPSYDDWSEEIQNYADYFETDNIRLHLYDIQANRFDRDLPALIPYQTGVDGMLDDLNGGDVVPAPYTNPPYWSTATDGGAGPYDFGAFDFGSGPEDLTQYVFQESDGTPFLFAIAPQASGSPVEFAFLDMARAEVADIIITVLQGYYDSASQFPRGYYLDQTTGGGLGSENVFDGDEHAIVLIFNEDPSSAALRANDGGFVAGKTVVLDAIRANFRAADPDFVTTGEGMDEMQLGHVDVMNTLSNTDPDALGTAVYGFTQVFGQYQRTSDLGITIAPSSAVQLAFWLNWITGSTFHRGQPIAWNLAPWVDPLFNVVPLVENSPQDFIARWVKILLDSWTWTQKYREGEPLRPTESSWELPLIASQQDLATYLQSNNLHMQDSVWRCPEDGDCAILVTSWLIGSSSYRIRLDSDGWPLPAGTKKLYVNTGSGRTLITTFTDSVDHTATLAGPAVYLFEVSLT